jgi:hypothetical protein
MVDVVAAYLQLPTKLHKYVFCRLFAETQIKHISIHRIISNSRTQKTMLQKLLTMIQTLLTPVRRLCKS